MTSGKLFTCFGAPFFCPCPSVSLSLPLYSFTKNNKWTVHLTVIPPRCTTGSHFCLRPSDCLTRLSERQSHWLPLFISNFTFLLIFYCHFTVQVCMFIYLILSYYCTLLTSYVYVIFSLINLLFYFIFLKTTMCYINELESIDS